MIRLGVNMTGRGREQRPQSQSYQVYRVIIYLLFKERVTSTQHADECDHYVFVVRGRVG
jgi:hypothetical protein